MEEEKKLSSPLVAPPPLHWCMTYWIDSSYGISSVVSTEPSLGKRDDVTNLLTQDLRTLCENTQKQNVILHCERKALHLPTSNSANPPLRGAVETLSELISSYWKRTIDWRTVCELLPSWCLSLNRNISPRRERLPTKSWELVERRWHFLAF